MKKTPKKDNKIKKNKRYEPYVPCRKVAGWDNFCQTCQSFSDKNT